MAEFAQKKIEELRPILEQMKKLELFNDKEIREITKKWKDYEYKLQRCHKSKEDYARYIQYQMNLMRLVKQRREKKKILKDKNIDFAIANKINHLYKNAISRYKNETRFWLAYITFCKQVNLNSEVEGIIREMAKVQQHDPQFWHIAARWNLEENNNPEYAKQLLCRGLLVNSKSQLLYTDLLRLELDEALVRNKKSDLEREYEISNNMNNSEIPVELQPVLVLYEQATVNIKDVKFYINLLNIIQKYEHTEKLQVKILSHIIKDYSHEPLMWDTMAKRELEGLVQPSIDDEETSMEVDNETTSLRDRIMNCHNVYQTAIDRLKSKEIWSLFIDCMLEINQDSTNLPIFKRKLLRDALIQGHQAKKLQEKHYLYWIDMLSSSDQQNNDVNKKLYQVFCWATEALPKSENLWQARLRYLFSTNQDELAIETFKKGVESLGDNSLSLWKLRLLHMQSKKPEKLEEFFKEALKSKPNISNFIKPVYIEWLVLTKDIDAARKVYNKLCLMLPPCLELHQKMAALEISQLEVSSQFVRKIYETMTLHFGKKNIDIWLEYIVFEMKYGDTEKSSNIYHRARKILESSLIENFTSKFSIIKANPNALKISF